MVVTGLCSCNNEDENRVIASDNLLASIQRSEDAPSYDFSDSAEKPEGYDDYITKTGNIAVQLLKQSSDSKENTIISPVAVALTMSALENSANQSTQKQIKGYLGKNTQTAEEINQYAAYLTQRMSFFNNENSGIYNVNSLWISDQLSPKRSFLQKIENNYNMSAYKTDFGADNVSTVIKNLISDNSNSLINADSINVSNDYQMYIDCSTIVSDNWLNSYNDSDIKKDTFTKNDGSTVDVNYLTSPERIFKSDNAQGFIKDVKNTTCKLMCIMPDEDVTLDEYISELTAEQLLDMSNTVSPTKFTNVSIPEFSVTKSGSLKNTLEGIGLECIFQKDANFTKGFSEGVFVNDITQTVSITVDKNGISTNIQNTEEASKQKTEGSLVFNRPFIYAVIDNESNTPIIIGTINNPLKA